MDNPSHIRRWAPVPLMRIRVKNRFVLFLFGWGLFPSYAEAEHGLWLQWFRDRRK